MDNDRWEKISVWYQASDVDMAAWLITGVFQDFGANGVVVDDPRPEPVAADVWAGDEIPVAERFGITGFLPILDGVAENRRLLVAEIKHQARQNGFTVEFEFDQLVEKDWAHAWKAHFWPEKIGEHLVVKPTWRDYSPAAGEQVIALDPGMAFGTGTHPSTAMCLQLLEKTDCRDKRFLDIGTGSGILMIAAALMGAKSLYGIDIDPLAIETAAANLTINHIPKNRYTLKQGHLAEAVEGPFDIAVANILAHIIIELLDHLAPKLSAGGIFICSGIIEKNHGSVADKIRAAGFSNIELRRQDEWVAIAGQKISEK